MTKQQVVSAVTSNERYIAICRRLLRGKSTYKDLYQDFIVKLLELPESRFNNIKCPDCFAYKILSDMSVDYIRGAVRVRKREQDVKQGIGKLNDEYDYKVDLRAKRAKRFIENLSYHDRKIIEEWTDGKSDRRIAKENKVPRYFVTKKIKTITQNIRQEIKVKELGQPIKILLVVQPNTTALQYHRQLIPHERLQKTHGGEFKIEVTKAGGAEASIDEATDEQLKDYQIIYYLRQISFNRDKVDPTLERIRRLGLKVVLDIDDYWFLPPEHHWHDKYKDKKIAENTIDTLKKVDWVVTTTPYFASKIKEHNKNITVLPNCISPDAKQFERREIESGRVRFGWIGGVFHKPDIDEMEESFKLLNGTRAKEIRDDFQ